MTKAPRPSHDENSRGEPSLGEKLRAVLDGDFAETRDAARAFVSQPHFAPVSPDLPKEEYREKTLGWIRDMVEAGFTRLPYDKKYGGAGENKNYMNIVEIIAHQDLSLAIKQGVQFGLFGLGLYALGTDKHHAAHMPDVMSGKLLGGFAMTEVGGGSDVQGVATEAVYDHATRSFTLHTPTEDARKAYIGNAALHGEMMVVFAQLKMDKDAPSEGVHAFLVPVRDKQGNTLPGIRIEDCGHKIGLNGIDNGYIAFDNIRVPYDDMLDRFAQIDADGAYQSEIKNRSRRFFKMISTLVTGRVFVSMVALSGAKNALTSAVDFAESRKVFGDTLMDKQATQSRLLPHIAQAYALHFATRALVDKLHDNAPDLETAAAAIKAASSDEAVRAVDEARKLAGGAGYMSEQRYGALRNDMDIFRTFEGDNTVLRLLVAKNRLGDLTRKFNKSSGGSKIAKMAALSLREKMFRVNSAKSRTDNTHLLSSTYHQQAFAARERTMIYALSRKIATLAKTDGLPQALNKCQDDMIAYADAYAERVMLDRFVEAVKSQKDPEVKSALKDVCDLFAVDTLRRNGLWYVENGMMTPRKTKALAGMQESLQQKIRPQAAALVQGFAVPPALLTVPPAQPKPAPKKPPAP